ncbi:TonB-dependent receptor plug domain-containing protein [Pseudochryseolinea flava]|uniref:TonB-dependent receptor n=1 Tax=Pseudochryseolinea flava TaxID=2059302 RepID=A0A364Y5U4_9BACT|nr:TonB-dependent receptor [Pseudochryseolinea flava]RAW02358.1 TonB-dependent receptor [Pseudochryseolinea flava]
MSKLLSILLLIFSIVTNAQDTLKIHALDEVVVTGVVEPQSVQKSVYNVRTISMERLKAQGATRLQDVLNAELNIRFSQDLALGGSNLSMVGLPGQNVKVLLDGVPIIGRQGTGNEININQININTIERIEIVEGPMSVIYGADALAGVINIITKKNPENKLDVSATIHEESIGSEYSLAKGIHNQNVSVGYKLKSIYANANVTRNDFNGWKGDATGRELAWHPKLQWLAGGVMGLQKQKVNAYYRFDFLDEKIHNPSEFSGLEAIDQNYLTDRLMHQAQVNGHLSEKIQFNGAASFTDFERRTQSIVVDRKTGRETLAEDTLHSKDEFRGATLRGSLHIKIWESVSLQPGFDFNSEIGKGSRLLTGDNAITDYAGFLLADINVARWSFRPGVRIVRNSVYDAPPLIPSFNAKVSLGGKNDVRIGYGRGFRAPSIRELYFNFFDASHSIAGNPNLEAELSHSFNVSWNNNIQIAKGILKTSLSTFYNDVKNLIDYGRLAGSRNTTYINVNNFKSKGATLQSTFRRNAIEMRFGIGYTGRYNRLVESDEALPTYTWSPEINASVSYPIVKTLTVSMFYKYTGVTKAYVIDPSDSNIVLAKTGSFHWADITMQKEFGSSLTLSGGVRNLFDITSISNSSPSSVSTHSGDSGVSPIAYGRSFFLSINFKFQKTL